MFYEMLYGKTPFHGKTEQELLRNIKKTHFSFPQNTFRSHKLTSLIEKMLVFEEAERISWDDLYNENFS